MKYYGACKISEQNGKRKGCADKRKRDRKEGQDTSSQRLNFKLNFIFRSVNSLCKYAFIEKYFALWTNSLP